MFTISFWTSLFSRNAISYPSSTNKPTSVKSNDPASRDNPLNSNTSTETIISGNSELQEQDLGVDKLCKACGALTSKIEELITSGRVDSIKLPLHEDLIPLGTYRKIRGRVHCPICRLICRNEQRAIQKHRSVADPTSSSDPIFFSLEQDVIVHGENQLFFSLVRCYSGHRLLGLYTVLSPPTAWIDRRLLLTRDAREIKKKGRLIRKWMRHCETKHGLACRPIHLPTSPYGPGSGMLILVNIKELCLVLAPQRTRYAALSYVWGQRSFFTVTKSNFFDLCKPGALDRVVLPRTIRDSITIAGLAGENYIWIDSLCIPQDDSDQKHGFLARMDFIFSRASFVLVAMSGNDADAGLFCENDETFEINETLPSGTTITSLSICYPEYTHSFTHNKRAWT